MATKRSQITAALVTALESASVTVDDVTYTKPADLEVYRYRVNGLVESDLAVGIVYPLRDEAERSRMGGTILHRFRCRVVLRCSGDTPDEALDDYVEWVTAVVASDPSLGGLALDAVEESVAWDAEMAETVMGEATVEFLFTYETSP